jgi:mannose-1-phosphate guanylyltransferase/phosphomannomutase
LESIFPGAVNTGVYVLEPALLDMLRLGEKYDFSHDLFPRLLDENRTLVGHMSEAYWTDIGTVNSYRQSCFDALNGLVDVRIPGKCVREGVHAEENALIEEGASLKGPILLGRNVRIGTKSRIEGPTIIGSDSSIGDDAHLLRTIAWNDVHIGAGATIDGGIIADHNTIEANANISSSAVRGPACETDARA